MCWPAQVEILVISIRKLYLDDHEEVRACDVESRRNGGASFGHLFHGKCLNGGAKKRHRLRTVIVPTHFGGDRP